ncbi:ABC transporter permease [Ignavigranum ruoffiae]|uniref:ABC transporter permease n=1 Tax=Ignavigranum ruoffiae TaxID=89093 RepID=UPI0024ACC4C6|nr:ABC transporter permease subunit [Ignavigranum ruoffiae]
MMNHFQRYWQLYVLLAPAVIYFLIFHYGPMYGVQIAFKDYKPSLGILDSPWVGFKHFKRFFNSYYFSDLMRNTLQISLYELVVGFPMPIILALLFNELRNGFFKKFAQTVTYAPHFISTVVIVGMLVAFLSPSTGLLNHLSASLGFERVAFLEEASWFKTIYVFSGIWQNTGWNTIIYMAALSGVDPQLYEAASIDGASRWQKLIYINLPALIPTMVILLILNFGSIMAMGYEKILLMQNALNISESNVIATFTYKQGLLDGNYSYAAAIGLFNSAINAILLVVVNKFSRKLSRISLW